MRQEIRVEAPASRAGDCIVLRALMDASFEAHRLGAFQARCRDVWALALEKPLPCGSDFTAKPTILS